MVQLHPVVTTLLAVGFLALVSYCAVTFTNAASFSLRHAQVATGSLSVSQQQFTLQFQTEQRSSYAAPPPVRISPKPHQAAPALPPRVTQRHR
jgi:hypothetical protein